MEVVIGFVLGFAASFAVNRATQRRSIRAIEKDLTEQYRGETFASRAKRASK